MSAWLVHFNYPLVDELITPKPLLEVMNVASIVSMSANKTNPIK